MDQKISGSSSEINAKGSSNCSQKKIDSAQEGATQSSKVVAFDKEPTYEDVFKMFINLYGTEENYVRSYGGAVAVTGVSLSKAQALRVTFNRAIAFPRELLLSFNPGFEESVPPLTPAAADLELIQKEYENQVQSYQEALSQGLTTEVPMPEECTEDKQNLDDPEQERGPDDDKVRQPKGGPGGPQGAPGGPQNGQGGPAGAQGGPGGM